MGGEGPSSAVLEGAGGVVVLLRSKLLEMRGDGEVVSDLPPVYPLAEVLCLLTAFLCYAAFSSCGAAVAQSSGVVWASTAQGGMLEVGPGVGGGFCVHCASET